MVTKANVITPSIGANIAGGLRHCQLFVLTLFLTVAHGLSAIKLAPVVDGISDPVGIAIAPGEEDRFYILEQRGRIRVVEKGKLRATPFLNIESKVTAGGEMGLLGLAFHPKYAENGKYYINYTSRRPKLTTVISEMTRDAKVEREILTFEQPYTNHNGGDIAFDKSGYLYLTTGDGGSGGDPHGNGQSVETLLGKILRISVGGGGPTYSIPSDNPFAKNGGRKEIFAWGLRNPWRISFDRKTGVLFAADVGQHKWEEINRIEKGGNYGWNAREGAHCFKPAVDCPSKGLIEPIHEYSHAEGYSITGGYVYRGKKMLELEGAYLYADYGSGKIWALRLDASQSRKVSNDLLLDTSHQISAFGQEADGEILVVAHRGAVFRLVP